MKITIFISYGSDGDELLDAQAHTTREDAAGRIKTSYESYLSEGGYDPDDTFCSDISAQIAFTDRSWIYLQVMESYIEIEGVTPSVTGSCGTALKGEAYAKAAS